MRDMYGWRQSLTIFGWPVELSSFTEREVAWCYNVSSGHVSDKSMPEKQAELIVTFTKLISAWESKHGCLTQSNARKTVYDRILTFKEKNITDLSWIDIKDRRLLLWLYLNFRRFLKSNDTKSLLNFKEFFNTSLLAYPYSQTARNKPLGSLKVEVIYDTVVQHIDANIFDEPRLDGKQLQVDKLDQRYRRARLSDKNAKWINRRNMYQLQWIWEYLKKPKPINSDAIQHLSTQRADLNDFRMDALRKALNGFYPQTTSEYYDLILASFDSMAGFSPFTLMPDYSERDAFLTKIKAAWSQQKLRDADKTQKTTPLSLNRASQKKLKELAKISKISDSELLRRLIDTEHQRVLSQIIDV